MFEGFDSTNDNQSYQVLARRTRPQAFNELVGQEVVAKALEGMLGSQKIPHAFLFTGTRGTGKTSSARILAKSICCEKGPTATPCQTCVHCVQITACAHEDVLEIDGASNTGVDNIRELRESARFYPNSSRYKIFIIDEVHMLSIGAFNALLKTLEEPPPKVIFILATTELHKVPVTVRSRCMIFSFRKVDTETIAAHLKNILTREQVTFDDDALMMVAREAKGSLRDSLSLLEQLLALGGGQHVTTETARSALSVMGEEIAESLFSGILARDSATCLEILRNADGTSLDMATVLENTAGMFRSALLIKDARDEQKAMRLAQLLPAEFQKIRLLSASVSVAALSEIFRTLSLAAKDLSRTNSQLAWAELAVLDCVSRADWLSSGELLGLLSGAVAHTPAQGASALAPQAAAFSTKASAFTPSEMTRVPTATGSVLSEMPQALSPSQAIAEPIRTPSLDKVDMQAFAKLVTFIERRSLGLATKLKHASLDAFHTTLVQFADIPHNRVYTQMTEPDARVFLEALKECGFDRAELKGLELPKGVQWRPSPSSANAPSTGNSTGNSSGNGARSAGGGVVSGFRGAGSSSSQNAATGQPKPRPMGGVSFLDKLASGDVFADPLAADPRTAKSPGANPQLLGETAEKKNNLKPPAGFDERSRPPFNTGATAFSDSISSTTRAPAASSEQQPTSLATLEKANKQKEFLLREEKVRNLQPIQKLAGLATRMEFLPYEAEENPDH